MAAAVAVDPVTADAAGPDIGTTTKKSYFLAIEAAENLARMQAENEMISQFHPTTNGRIRSMDGSPPRAGNTSPQSHKDIGWAARRGHSTSNVQQQ